MSDTPGTDEESLAATRPRREIRPTQKVIEMEERMDSPQLSSLTSGLKLAQGQAQTSKTKAAPGRRGRGNKSSHSRTGSSTLRHDVPITFTPEIPIYFWPSPRPTDFTALSCSQREWKRGADEQDKENDYLDGAEDWYLFDDTLTPRTIASNFVVRAKRAFRESTSWDDYVAAEMKAYSEVEARRQSPEYLSTERRMMVWDSLKHRLCEEIWSEAYRDPPGLVRLRVGADGRRSRGESRGRNESVKTDPYASNPTGAQPRSTAKRRRLEASQEDAAEGVVGHTLDPDRLTQPFYAGEEAAPHGIAKDMAEMRRVGGGGREGRRWLDQRHGEDVVDPVWDWRWWRS